ncbi:MAG: 16S rRNA (cytidine(1402)-2'-O)-methyltransferase [Holophagaceae bacterium]|nr:16S rRNA (cytidine(1402)-2'-O)-methyltransferase [Holophagaceae bacterium]
MNGLLILIPTPLGNLKDITRRAIEALEACDLVACEDTRRTGALLKHLNISKPLQRFDDHSGPREADMLSDALSLGKTVAYCSDAGMPGINDPGFELARLARESGSNVSVLPGPSIVTLAVAASGLPTHSFSFLGYLPPKASARQSFIHRLAGREETTIILESPYRIEDALRDFCEAMPDREMALGRELTKLHETWYRGTPPDVLAQLGTERRGELVLAVAGADAKRTVKSPDMDITTGTLPEWAKKFLDAAREGGMTLRDAVKPLARHLGKTPAELYKLATNRD